MPCLIIEKRDDGTVLVSAPQQLPPELMQDAEQVGSIEEAAQVLTQVLGVEDAEQQADPQAQSGAPTDPAASEQQPAAEPDADNAMQQGFTAVKGAPRR